MEFQADEIKYSSGKVSSYGMSLLNAYPESAGISYWNRKISLRRGKYVDVSNQYELSEITGASYENIVTPLVPKHTAKNKIQLFKNDTDTKAFFSIEFDPEKIEVEWEKIKLSAPEDKVVKAYWRQFVPNQA